MWTSTVVIFFGLIVAVVIALRSLQDGGNDTNVKMGLAMSAVIAVFACISGASIYPPSQDDIIDAQSRGKVAEIHANKGHIKCVYRIAASTTEVLTYTTSDECQKIQTLKMIEDGKLTYSGEAFIDWHHEWMRQKKKREHAKAEAAKAAEKEKRKAAARAKKAAQQKT